MHSKNSNSKFTKSKEELIMKFLILKNSKSNAEVEQVEEELVEEDFRSIFTSISYENLAGDTKIYVLLLLVICKCHFYSSSYLQIGIKMGLVNTNDKRGSTK